MAYEKDCSPALFVRHGARITDFVAGHEFVCDGVAQRIEEAPASMGGPPAFGVHALAVRPKKEKFRPLPVRERRGIGRPRNVGLPAVAKLDFRARAAIGPMDQQHDQCATAAAAASSINLPLTKRCRENGAAKGCGSSLAMVAAKTWPEPGVALNPPVPQPQLTNSPGTGVSPMIGERSGVTSTMPPQLRSMRSLRKAGKSSQTASSAWLLICSPPRCV